MRLLLTMNVPYTRSHGGANRSNLGLMEGLARQGHDVYVVTPALAQPSAMTYDEWRDELEARGVAILAQEADGTVRFTLGGVTVTAVRDPGKVRAALLRSIDELAPDRVLVSSEDPSQSLLAAALDAAPGRVVYLALTPPLFPFGPASLYPSETRTGLIRRAGKIACLSQVIADYVREHAGAPAFVYQPPAFGLGPFPRLANFDSGAVLLVNACDVKGLPIFLELARQFPGDAFAALAGYGTTEADRAALNAQPNVTLWRNERDLDALFRRTKVLVAPSLWLESFGMVVVDAMLRGVPVLAADFGALREAALGAAQLVPVQPITQYRRELGDNLLPIPIVPPQDCAPWIEALRPMLTKRARWEAAASAAHAAATAYVAGLGVGPFADMLAEAPAAAIAPVAPRPSKGAAEISPQQRALLLRRLRESGRAARAGAAIPKRPRGAPLPLSFAQSRLYFLWRLDPASAAYNCPSALRLRGPIDASRLAAALAGLVARRETLRTIICNGPEGPLQNILPPAPPDFQQADVSRSPADRRIEDAQRLIAQAATIPFNLETERPFRALLIRLAPEDHFLALTLHHIATDGWSTGLLIRDISALYSGAETDAGADAAALDYADYACWQREEIAGAELDRLLAYWTKALSGAPPVIGLPTDRPRLARPLRPGANHAVVLPAPLTRRLKSLGQQQGASLFMVLLAGFGILLHRLSRDGEIVIGAPVANRVRTEFESIVGFFVNTLALRLRFGGNPRFTDFLSVVRETTLAGFAHQALPFERLVEALAPDRHRSHTAVFQVMFSLQNLPGQELAMSGLSVEPIPAYSGVAKLDLNLELTETAQGVAGTLEYDRDLFDADTIESFVAAYVRLLEAIAAAPEQAIGALPLAAPEVAAAPAAAEEDPDLMTLVRAGAGLAPSALAVWTKSQTVDHGTLDAWSDQLAALLMERTQRREGLCESAVAICLDRSATMIAAVLGVLKAGAACVPLDPVYPAERLDLMWREATVAAVLTESRHAGLFADSPVPVLVLDDPQLVLPPADSARRLSAPHRLAPAYVLYTSGSTGKPKGVSFPRAALANLVLWHLDKFPGPARMTQFASLGFDASFHEILATLAGGGALYVLGDDDQRDLDRLPRFFAAHAIAKAILPVVAVHRLAEAMIKPDAPVLALRHLISTGEALSITPALSAWLAQTPNLSLHNDYGPTETHVVTSTVVSSLPDLGAPFPPIGHPIRASGFRILDAYLNPAPKGLPGELFLTGACLARGYRDRPDATAEKFLPDPLSARGERMYRTGDLARERRDGALAYFGRADQQIKIRGYRIEPGDVEHALLGAPGVADCLVIARGAAAAERQLVAYVIPDPDGPTPEPGTLAERLRSLLPPFMIPSAYVRLPAFPLNANGKIDRAALPAPAAKDSEAGERSEGGAPRTELEATLAQIWKNALQRPTLGVDDNFFALGGHSLLMIQVTARIARELNVELSVQEFLDHPTIAAQAVAVDALLASRDDAAELESLLDEIEALPMSEVERLAGPAPQASRDSIAGWIASAIEAAGPQTSVPQIAAIGFPSSGRAALLEGAIRGYAANALDYGRRLDIVVCNNPADAADDDAYRSMLARVARDVALPIRYAGAAEKRVFIERLASEADLDPALLSAALNDDTRSGAAYGVNRNALLLDGVDDLFLSFDDDTTAQTRLPNALESGVALRSEPNVSEIRVLAGGAGEDSFVSGVSVDLVAAHEGVLGLSVGAALRRHGARVDAEAAPGVLGAPETARVVASYNGWAGDPGWESGADARILTGASWEWLTRSPDAYFEALDGAPVVRYAPRALLSRAPEFFAIGCGFDARADLPPFLPRFRREDVCFGASLRHGLDGGFLAHLPVVIGHGRPQRGTARFGRDLIDVAEIIDTIFEHAPRGSNWTALGQALIDAGRLPGADFKAQLVDRLVARIEKELTSFEQRIRACPADREFWARDARASVEILRKTLARPADLLPRRVFKAASEEEARAALQCALVDMGRLFVAWPQAMAAARRMKADGVRLSQPVRPTA